MNKPPTPFAALGQHLKYVREQSRQTLAEVSGAVEIDEQLLQHIEAGEKRPPEEILMLLISHFGVADQEAAQLWELAGYDSDLPEQFKSEAIQNNKPVVMLLALDMRTVYSDGLEVQSSQAGLTLNFTQTSGRLAQPLPIARVGMSYEQAHRVVADLQLALLKAAYARQPRALPPPAQSDNSGPKS